MGLWDTIKNKAQPPRMIANPDVLEVINPEPGAPINGARTPGLKFKPVEPVETLINPNLDLVAGDPEDEQGTVVAEFIAKPARRELPHEIRARKVAAGEAPPPDKGGRPRVHLSNAEKQKAYRQRMKAKKS